MKQVKREKKMENLVVLYIFAKFFFSHCLLFMRVLSRSAEIKVIAMRTNFCLVMSISFCQFDPPPSAVNLKR